MADTPEKNSGVEEEEPEEERGPKGIARPPAGGG